MELVQVKTYALKQGNIKLNFEIMGFTEFVYKTKDTVRIDNIMKFNVIKSISLFYKLSYGFIS